MNNNSSNNGNNSKPDENLSKIVKDLSYLKERVRAKTTGDLGLQSVIQKYLLSNSEIISAGLASYRALQYDDGHALALHHTELDFAGIMPGFSDSVDQIVETIKSNFAVDDDQLNNLCTALKFAKYLTTTEGLENYMHPVKKEFYSDYQKHVRIIEYPDHAALWLGISGASHAENADFLSALEIEKNTGVDIMSMLLPVEITRMLTPRYIDIRSYSMAVKLAGEDYNKVHQFLKENNFLIEYLGAKG